MFIDLQLAPATSFSFPIAQSRIPSAALSRALALRAPFKTRRSVLVMRNIDEIKLIIELWHFVYLSYLPFLPFSLKK